MTFESEERDFFKIEKFTWLVLNASSIRLMDEGKGLTFLTSQRKMKRSIKFFLTFHRWTPSFSASVSTLPNPQGEYVFCSVDVCVVQMTATHAPEFRLRLAILAVCRSTAVAVLTGVMRRQLVNRRFVSKRLFQFVPAGFQY